MMTELIYHNVNSCQLLILATGYNILLLDFIGTQCVAWGRVRIFVQITSASVIATRFIQYIVLRGDLYIYRGPQYFFLLSKTY